MILISYAIPKYSRARLTRNFKRILPRKKSSSKRIGINHQWNLLEESSQKKCYHLSNLNLNNEVNDNIVNENRERIMNRNKLQLARKSEAENYNLSSSQMDVLHNNTITYSSPLTPPITPQIGYNGFQFSSKENAENHISEPEVEVLPLTPCDSEVFAY